jgi:hypothetical protein
MIHSHVSDLHEKLHKIIEKYHSHEPTHLYKYIRSHEEYAEQLAVPLLAQIAELEAQTFYEPHQEQAHLFRIAELEGENIKLRERCHPSAVIMIDGVGHYVSEKVYDFVAELEERNITEQ